MFPDYNGGSIVNLMATIEKALGGRPKYKELKILRAKEIDRKNVVLIVLDGLGYEQLTEFGKSRLLEKCAGTMTSVFPPTTAAAITTFYSGLAPNEHGITGWFMFLKELGSVTAILPFEQRTGRGFETAKAKDIVKAQGIAERIKAEAWVVMQNHLLKSEYSSTLTGRAKRKGFSTLKGMARQIKSIVAKGGKRKFVYAYWPLFDTLCHKHGTRSREVKRHFREIERFFEILERTLKGTNTLAIITADHGLIDTREKIKVGKDFTRFLHIPLCGESRAAYCYVKPGHEKEFIGYAKQKFRGKAELVKSEELIRRGAFGTGRMHEALPDRTGDYVLLAKDGVVIKDFLAGEEEKFFEANHGGTSRREMVVPLVLIRG